MGGEGLGNTSTNTLTTAQQGCCPGHTPSVALPSPSLVPQCCGSSALAHIHDYNPETKTKKQGSLFDGGFNFQTRTPQTRHWETGSWFQKNSVRQESWTLIFSGLSGFVSELWFLQVSQHPRNFSCEKHFLCGGSPLWKCEPHNADKWSGYSY